MSQGKQVGGSGANSNSAPCNIADVGEALRRFGIELELDVASRLILYLELLLRWNEKVALTSITDPHEILERHFAESIFGAIRAGIQGGTLLDIGSGSGFPAIPIALAVPNLREVLLEPNLKKSVFLSEVCRKLSLDNRVKVERARLEDYGGRGSHFDFITTRAVKLTPERLRQCAALLCPKGRLVMWLGSRDIESVLQTGHWQWSAPVRLPGSKQRLILWGHPL
ncbi:MAG TPA: 16S rRNA (guanine(527)-N(7))-methyltransferase RsmG [Candidatus Acidoferrales bacterium]|nr:16S rRNA (guanine(527)-N(7))-methyltransferase RsmG [Candidatus Acidoferrales bacterium]